MKNSPHRRKHQQKKAIRAAQKEETYETEPKVMKDKEKETYLSSPRQVKISKAKASSKHKHQMTSPDDVTFETEPEHVHQEGEHWIRTIQKQTLQTASRLQKKLQNFGFNKRKRK